MLPLLRFCVLPGLRFGAVDLVRTALPIPPPPSPAAANTSAEMASDPEAVNAAVKIQARERGRQSRRRIRCRFKSERGQCKARSVSGNHGFCARHCKQAEAPSSPTPATATAPPQPPAAAAPAAAPAPTVTKPPLQRPDFSGVWSIDLARSDDPIPQLAAMGVGWFQRGVVKTTLPAVRVHVAHDTAANRWRDVTVVGKVQIENEAWRRECAVRAH